MEEKIIALLKGMVEEDRINEIEFSGKTDIINEVGLDSLGMVAFLLQLEEELEIEIDITRLEVSHLSSIDNLCAFINSSN
jgi:acyl carrier protein